MSAQAPVIGIKGTISFNGQVYDLHNTINLLPADTTTFPPSEGPRSIVNGADELQKAKYINAYGNTDEYLTKLRAEKKAAQEVSSHSDDLCKMTHCFTRTRQETDHVLTMLMNNGALPTKRKAPEAAVDGDKEEVQQQRAVGVTQEELELVSEEIKRQRALDTTEYFSQHSSDEDEEVGKAMGDEAEAAAGEEVVGLLDRPEFKADTMADQ